MVFNVYGPNRRRFDESSDESFEQAYYDMAMAPITAPAVVPDMRATGWGRLLTIGSICAKQLTGSALGQRQSSPGSGAISDLSAELGRFGITVNTLETGGFMTDRYRSSTTARIAAERGQDFDEVVAGRRPWVGGNP